MKTNSEIAHLWAHQLPQPKTNGSLFYNGKTIYSYGYHFPIAKLLEDNKTVLITNRTYSVSTSKHQGYVSNAVSHLNKIYCNNPVEAHIDNIGAFIKEIKNEMEQLIKAKKPEIYLSKIGQIKDSLSTYLDYFKLKLTSEQKSKIKIKGLTDYLIKIEKHKEREAENKRANLILGKPLYYLAVHNFRNRIAETLSKNEDKLARLYHSSIGSPVIFKISETQIISSKGVKLPIDVAKRYINRFLNSEIKVGNKILDYGVNFVDNTLIKIGCHDIYRAEIEYLNSQLN